MIPIGLSEIVLLSRVKMQHFCCCFCETTVLLLFQCDRDFLEMSARVIFNQAQSSQTNKRAQYDGKKQVCLFDHCFENGATRVRLGLEKTNYLKTQLVSRVGLEYLGLGLGLLN